MCSVLHTFRLHQRYGNCGRGCRQMQESFNSAVICQSNGDDNAKVGREADDGDLCWAWRTKRDGQIPARGDGGTQWLGSG